MARLDSVRRINYQDYPEEDQETVEKLSVILNFFMEDVVNAINGNLDFENMNRELITLTVTVGTNGVPIAETRFASSLDIAGLKVIRADNLSNTTGFVSNAPFITYRNSGTGIYTVTNITGLTAGQSFRLVIEAIGN